MTMTSMPLDNAVLVVADNKTPKELLTHALIMQVQTVEVMTAAGMSIVQTHAEVTMATISTQIATVVPVVAETVSKPTLVIAVKLKEKTVRAITAAGMSLTHPRVEITITMISTPVQCAVLAEVRKNY